MTEKQWGPLLGSLLANIFMISLEDSTLTKLELYLCNWKRYVVMLDGFVAKCCI